MSDHTAPPPDRADRLLVRHGLARSRARARALIDAGAVTAGGRPVRKAGDLVPPDTILALTTPDHPWVSRGGLKLTAALDAFAIDPAGLTCLDLGASTGGFTQVLLARRAAQVVAVDVGHGQLDPTVAGDPRVIAHDGLNVRALTAGHLPTAPALIVADLSFIGLRTALPAALELAAPAARLIALIKPQFEVGQAAVGKGGVVRTPTARAAACHAVEAWLAARGWPPLGRIDSPIAGGDGNLEFLVAARQAGPAPTVMPHG